MKRYGLTLADGDTFWTLGNLFTYLYKYKGIWLIYRDIDNGADCEWYQNTCTLREAAELMHEWATI